MEDRNPASVGKRDSKGRHQDVGDEGNIMQQHKELDHVQAYNHLVAMAPSLFFFLFLGFVLSIMGNENSAQNLSDLSSWNSLGPWMSAPSGHGCPRRHACDFDRPDRSFEPGYPRE